jgi:hypothetical protein
VRAEHAAEQRRDAERLHGDVGVGGVCQKRRTAGGERGGESEVDRVLARQRERRRGQHALQLAKRDRLFLCVVVKVVWLLFWLWSESGGQRYKHIAF